MLLGVGSRRGARNCGDLSFAAPLSVRAAPTQLTPVLVAGASVASLRWRSQAPTLLAAHPFSRRVPWGASACAGARPCADEGRLLQAQARALVQRVWWPGDEVAPDLAHLEESVIILRDRSTHKVWLAGRRLDMVVAHHLQLHAVLGPGGNFVYDAGPTA